MTTEVILVMACAAFLIGFNKAGIGGTLGPLVTVFVALAMPADEAIGLLLPMLVVADLFAVATHWGQWHRGILIRLLAAATVGIIVGSLVISSISEPMLRRIIAAAMLGFVAYYFWSRNPRSGEGTARRHAWPAGLVGGVTSTLAHLGGPPIMAYLMTTDLRPRPLVATTTALFAAMNLLKIPGYLAAGLLDTDLI
ncbi:MAG: sulfite exporter TauE/SafE family protein, partial [bacterium]|nr:sulfite exporter TauE/SafE family protein [bacterium]